MLLNTAIDNGQCTIDNEGVAKRHILIHFPKENTIIVHYQLSIVNSSFDAGEIKILMLQHTTKTFFDNLRGAAIKQRPRSFLI